MKKIPGHIHRTSDTNKIPAERKSQIVEIYANSHKGATIKDFREILTVEYGYTHSASWLSDVLEDAGLYEKKRYAL